MVLPPYRATAGRSGPVPPDGHPSGCRTPERPGAAHPTGMARIIRFAHDPSPLVGDRRRRPGPSASVNVPTRYRTRSSHGPAFGYGTGPEIVPHDVRLP